MSFKIPFGLDSSKFKSGLKDMRAGVKAFSEKVEGDLTSGNKGFLKAAGGIGLVTAALTGAVAAAGLLVKRGIDFGNKISNQAAEAKTSVEGLQVALNLGEDAGAQSEQVVAALKNINTRAVDAANGATQYQEALARLNIDSTKFTKLASERKLEAVAKGFVNAEDDAQAYRDILTLLGEDAGPKLIKVLDQLGNEGFDSLNKKMEESGRIIKKDVIDNIDEASKAYNKLQKHIDTQTATGAGNLASLMGFGTKRDQDLLSSELADMLSFGAFDFTGKTLKGIQKEEDINAKYGLEDRKAEAQIAAIDKELAELAAQSPEAKAKRAKAKKSKAIDQGLFGEFVSPQKESSFQGVPVSSLQAIGGGGNVGGVSKAVGMDIARNDWLKQIAENTNNNNNGAGDSAGPPLG